MAAAAAPAMCSVPAPPGAMRCRAFSPLTRTGAAAPRIAPPGLARAGRLEAVQGGGGGRAQGEAGGAGRVGERAGGARGQLHPGRRDGAALLVPRRVVLDVRGEAGVRGGGPAGGLVPGRRADGRGLRAHLRRLPQGRLRHLHPQGDKEEEVH
ncbi:hypothetical protein PVAP13_5KG655400 [Panicum virgatum]|uniref:Uncharacterized protein n=1 Tax=Panicum virgatum TaxID=38727 RepID=A0A8T0SU48_PANVG|nr:hypothetical protein PVAP13_5KG655400 [Panicum virgatum]